VREHLGGLQRYALVFPIARPRLALVHAAVEAPRRPSAAHMRLIAAAADADRRGLRFEATLARRIAGDLGGHPPP
jgi:hypothetical protein